jgi:hypothetical protein
MKTNNKVSKIDVSEYLLSKIPDHLPGLGDHGNWAYLWNVSAYIGFKFDNPDDPNNKKILRNIKSLNDIDRQREFAQVDIIEEKDPGAYTIKVSHEKCSMKLVKLTIDHVHDYLVSLSTHMLEIVHPLDGGLI